MFQENCSLLPILLISQGIRAGFKTIIGGKIGAFADMCDKAREEAYTLMVEQALKPGANAVVGVRYDTSEEELEKQIKTILSSSDEDSFLSKSPFYQRSWL